MFLVAFVCAWMFFCILPFHSFCVCTCAYRRVCVCVCVCVWLFSVNECKDAFAC